MMDTQTNRELYEQYFHEFLPSILGRQLIEELKSLSCLIGIKVTDSDDPPWHLVVEEGCLKNVIHDGVEPSCFYVLNIATLLEVVRATCTPQEAFFETRINIEGDMEQGLVLSNVLAQFFERYPFNH